MRCRFQSFAVVFDSFQIFGHKRVAFVVCEQILMPTGRGKDETNEDEKIEYFRYFLILFMAKHIRVDYAGVAA